MANLRKFVFKDEEGIIEDNVYYARPNREGLNEKGVEIIIEDDIIPFLKKQGYKEEKFTETVVGEIPGDEGISADF